MANILIICRIFVVVLSLAIWNILDYNCSIDSAGEVLKLQKDKRGGRFLAMYLKKSFIGLTVALLCSFVVYASISNAKGSEKRTVVYDASNTVVYDSAIPAFSDNDHLNEILNLK